MLNFSEATEPDIFYSHEHGMFTVLVFALITLVGVPGNALVLWVTGVKMERTVTTVLFGNLAVADIMCCLSVPFFTAQFLYREWLICLAVWMMSFMMCLPDLIYHKTETVYNMTICFSQYPNRFSVIFTHLTFGFLIPLIIISASYISLSIKAYNITSLNVSKKTIKVALGIVVAFFITWAPFHIMGVVLLFTINDVVVILDLLAHALALFNSCINPLLYVLIGKVSKNRVRKSARGLMESVFHEDPSTSRSLISSKSQNGEGIPLEGSSLEGL